MSLIQIASKNDEKNKVVQNASSIANLRIKKNDVKIWLIDPTYTQQQISSESMPYAIGGIATFAEKVLDLKNPIKLFKYPEKLNESLKNDGLPDIIGFSNYIWNCELSLSLARRIKEVSPNIITVMGGPNYPVVKSEQESFLKEHPEIDFYVIGEGELAFAKLVEVLVNLDFHKENLNVDLPSVHYLTKDGNTSISDSIAERIQNLSEIPSPYTTGKLDEFFDGKLQPVIQTTRGCPFSCTFCVEGTQYYSKVNRNNLEKIESELDYIGSHMNEVRKMGGRNDLWLVDSNFGMYTQDLETCKIIAKCQEKYGWPEYVQCDTGKNNKQRVLEAAKLVKGAMRLSGSVQTLDKEVLKNIKRSNISGEELMKLANEADEIDADSRSEIILGLPGESLQSHFETLRTVINARFNHVNTYQLMMLPGTETYSKDTRDTYKMETKFRVLPRCFGSFDILGKTIKSAELEEICVSTSTLSFQDYLNCRKLHLIIHIFHNDGLFSSAIKLLDYLKIPLFEWIEALYDEEKKNHAKDLLDHFEKETISELWTEKNELLGYIQKSETIEHYIQGDLGYNLLFVHKAQAMKKYISDLKDLAKITLEKVIKKRNLMTDELNLFLNEIIEYDSCRISNIFDKFNIEPTMTCNYDVEKFLSDANPSNNLKYYKLSKPTLVSFIFDDYQKDVLDRSIKLYDSTDLGISRILTKVFVKKLLRKSIVKPLTQIATS